MSAPKSSAARYDSDGPEPTAIVQPVPVGLFVMLGLLFYWGTMYLHQHGGGFHPLVYEPYISVRDVDDHHPKSESAALMKKGGTAYTMYCEACHVANGQGNPSTQVPPLAGSEWVISEGAGRTIRIVLNSVTGPITVKGQEFNNPAMPAWRDTIQSDEELAALISFIRGNRAWGNSAKPVTPEQVKKIRDETAGRAVQWTAQELQGVPGTE